MGQRSSVKTREVMWFNITSPSSKFMGLASFRINDPKTLGSDFTPLSLEYLSSESSTRVSSWLPRLFSPSRQGPEAAGPSGPRSAQHPVPDAGPLRTVAAASAWPGASPGLASAQRLCPCVRTVKARIQGQDPWGWHSSSTTIP